MAAASFHLDNVSIHTKFGWYKILNRKVLKKQIFWNIKVISNDPNSYFILRNILTKLRKDGFMRNVEELTFCIKLQLLFFMKYRILILSSIQFKYSENVINQNQLIWSERIIYHIHIISILFLNNKSKQAAIQIIKKKTQKVSFCKEFVFFLFPFPL